MAPSAISMDPVSQLETESAFILEAATTDVKSNPHFEATKHALSSITTEVNFEDSTEPSSASEGFTDTPPVGFAVQQPSTVQPIVADGFIDEAPAAPVPVEASYEVDGFIDVTPKDVPVKEFATKPAPIDFAVQPVTEVPVDGPVEAEPAPVVPVEAPTSQVDESAELTPTGPTPVPVPAPIEAPTEVVKMEVEAPEPSVVPAAAAAPVPAPEPTKIQHNKFLPLNEIIPSVSEPNSGAKKLRKMIFETNELIICPGVYDGLSARTAIEVGFNAMYMVSDIP